MQQLTATLHEPLRTEVQAHRPRRFFRENSWPWTLAVAFGLTSVILPGLFEPILDTHPLAVYHWAGSASAMFAPVAVLFSTLWLCLFCLLLSARRPGRWRVAVWAGLLISLPWVIFRTVELLHPDSVPAWFHFPRLVLGVALWILVLLFWNRAPARTEKVLHLCATVLLFLAVSACLFAVRFCWYWWSARDLNASVPMHGTPSQVPGGPVPPRVIWILLDELSYQQLYMHRYPGLALPTFDALAAHATVFTQTRPAGTQTDRIVPSLLTGRPVADIHATPAGRLATLNPSTHTWERFDQRATVFQDALNSGRETGVAGWYNPYCRILPAVLDRCTWNSRETLANGLRSNGTVRSNLLSSVSTMVGNGLLRKFLWFTLGIPRPKNDDADFQIADFKQLSAAGDQLLTDPTVGFVLLHLPIPHPQGLYNRRTGQFTTGPSTYIDNLALADRYLAHVHFLLQQSGQWDGTTLVISGDHGWRTTMLWKTAHRWTAEEQQASLGGGFDGRPAYIVKLPNQDSGAVISTPFDILRTRSLFDVLLNNQVKTPAELDAWVTQQR